MRTNRGARVADVDQGGMRGAYDARLVVEPGAARLAAQRRPAEPLARMRAAVQAQRGAVRSVQRSFEANRQYHLALVAASENDFLIQLADRLWVARIGATIYERQVETQERMLLDVREHELILEAIEAGEGRKAESLTRRHLVDAMRRSLDILGAGQSGSGQSGPGA
jgi:DNA-binding GntR family transcriptional regulator